MSLVGSSSAYASGTGGAATLVPFQRKTFEAHGLIWVFYSEAGRIVFKTSSDGEVWSNVVG